MSTKPQKVKLFAGGSTVTKGWVDLSGQGKLGFPARCPFSPVSFLGEGSPIKIDDRKKGTLILTSLPEDLVLIGVPAQVMIPHWLMTGVYISLHTCIWSVLNHAQQADHGRPRTYEQTKKLSQRASFLHMAATRRDKTAWHQQSYSSARESERESARSCFPAQTSAAGRSEACYGASLGDLLQMPSAQVCLLTKRAIPRTRLSLVSGVFGHGSWTPCASMREQQGRTNQFLHVYLKIRK